MSTSVPPEKKNLKEERRWQNANTELTAGDGDASKQKRRAEDECDAWTLSFEKSC